MSADLKTAASAIPGSQLAPTQLATSEGALYTCPAGAAFIGQLILTNVTGSTATALVSLVKSGGTGVPGNRIIARTLAAGESAYLDVKLGEGDFLSGQSGTATAVSVVVTGTVFSASAGGALTGIQDDAIGSGGLTGFSPTVTGTNAVGTGSNRYLICALKVAYTTYNFAAWSALDTLSVTCADGAMTRLVSFDFSSNFGSVHLFGRANPSNTLHTITATAGKSGVSNDHLTLASMSLTGVGSVTGPVTEYNTGPLNLAATSALGHRVFFAGAFDNPPMGFNRRWRDFDGSTAPFTAAPHWLAFGDAPGAATVTATTSNSTAHAAVGIDLVPA